MPGGAGAGSALAHDLDDLARLVAACVEGDGRDIRHRLGQLDQGDVVGCGKKHDDQHRLATGHGLIDQRLWQGLGSGMGCDALDVPGYSVDHHLPAFSMLRKCVGGSNHPLRSDQNAVPFTGHVNECRELGRRNPILGVINIISNDNGIGD